MGKRLIIGCGYLGRRLAARWKEQGHQVFATTRSPQHAEAWHANGWNPIRCDVLDPGSLRDLPAVDWIVYAVGLDRTAGIPMRRVYVEGVTNLANRFQATEFNSTRLLYVSSTSVYGQTDGSTVDEQSPTVPLEESGQIVLAAEQALRERVPRAVVARFAGIYGPGRLLRAESLRRGEPIVGLPDKWLNLIHVLDGASAIDRLLEAGSEGSTYTVTDGSPVRRREFYSLLANLLHAPEPRWEQPPEPLPISERVDRRLSAPRLRALGWVPRYPDYRAGLAQAVEPSGST